ncbi:MAG: cysteine desulfurase family protein [Bacteroidota bacterium]|nr:cysteine desulfurase family protein [Bacteroidota bacterium]MDP4211947.1 cysteine desulfurase family protein [Bacteroidota bacterium]MDP4249248.1 cysteine desulfurase family protein [Bacteroidota bacterium]
MERIYFDNAATTALDPEVLNAMMPFLTEKFGNPSSIYSYGREVRMAIEQARKSVARILQVNPAEIFFTSGGTESTNTAIAAAVYDLECRHIITSPIEHHATLHTVEYYRERGDATVHYLKLLPDGHIDLEDLDRLLSGMQSKCLVSLMHANNEIGNLLDLDAAGKICKKYGAVFHSDTVQTVGHYSFNLRDMDLHFIAGAAHKFHGPKGVGILYVNESVKVHPYMHGGSQERNMRAGTENVYGIVGLAKALELANARLETEMKSIGKLKEYMASQLKSAIPETRFNGDAFGNCLYTVLSTSFPKSEKSEMLLFNLDINQICASGGSACTSGAEQGSHVIRALYPETDRVTVRFSFNRHNTNREVDQVVGKLKELI